MNDIMHNIYLNYVVSEVCLLSLFACSVFDVESADKVRSPTAQETVEQLEQNTRQHTQLRK